MFKKIFNDFYIRISSNTVNIREEDFKKMVHEIRTVINKYGVKISVFATPEEFISYIKREKTLSKKFKEIKSFFNSIKKELMSYKNKDKK